MSPLRLISITAPQGCDPSEAVTAITPREGAPSGSGPSPDAKYGLLAQAAKGKAPET